MKYPAKLSNTERQEQILAYLERRQRAHIEDLVAQFSVSPATARRDLEILSNRGKVQRVHGGALALSQAPAELPALQRAAEQPGEKKAIAQATAQLIAEGETIFLGSGTTVLELARLLRQRSLTVITNSLPVINLLADAPTITLIGLGGAFRASEQSFIGHITEQALAEVRADKVVMGVRAIHLEHGLTNDYLPETMTDRAILKAGREVIVAADHSKLNRLAAAFLAPLEAVHILITDAGAPADFLAAIQDKDISFIVA